LENVIIKFTADTTGLEPAIKQLALMGKITDEDAKKIAQINAEQQKFNQTVAQTSNEFSDFQKSFNGVTEDIKKEVISNAAKQLGEFTNEAKKGGEQIKSLKAELRELKAQIASGTLGEKEMRAATMRAAELTDNLGDVQQKIKALSSDTKRIDTVVEAFKGLAAATSVVTGVMGLLGSENKELEKTLLKVQSAMAILQGVQELANLATGEGILKTQLLSTYQALAGKTATVMGYEISGATAMATGGISLLLAGLVYVVSTMSDTTEEAEKLKEKTKEFYKANEEAFANLQKIRAGNIQDARGREKKLNEIAGNEELNQLLEKYKKGEMLAETYEASYAAIKTKYINNRKEIDKKYDDEIDKKNKEKNDKLIAQEKKRIEEEKRLRKEQNRVDREFFQASEKAFKDGEKTMSDVVKAENEERERIRKAGINSEIADQEKKFEKLLADRKKHEDDIKAANKKLQDDIREAIFQIAQIGLDTLFTITQQNIQARESEEIASIERRRDAELSNKSITEAQKAKIQERADREIANAKRKAWQQQQNADITQAIMNGALAITKTLSTLGVPAGLPAAAVTAVITAAQVATIKNQPVPKFAKGVEKLNGMGTETSDSILAMLSKNERVVPADVNNDYFPALSAIHNRKVDHTLANSVLTDLANGTFNVTQEQNVTTTIDYNRLEQALTKGKSKVVINLDEKGFSHYQTKSAGTTSYLNKKFKYEI
jgi:DNA repair exonuclease SbcCD ATPase subunit